MENMYKDIAPAIQKLSELFCVSADFLKEHWMEYVMEYGKFAYANEMAIFSLPAILMGVLTGMGVFSLLEGQNEKKRLLISAVSGWMLARLLLLTVALPYIVSPEMYSIDAVLKLIG